MNVFRKTVISLLFLVLLSCQETTGIQLRVENSSDFTYDNVSVNNISFGSLEPNEVSDYIPFENIYKSEFVEVIINGEKLQFVPEEFQSDEFYDQGKYKYMVDIVHKKWLSVKFVEE